MARYRKRPVVIEATQWFKMGDHPAVKPVPVSEFPMVNDANRLCGWVDTLESGDVARGLTVIPGDWIITGVKGEHYPCKPDIFASTYEVVEETEVPTEMIDVNSKIHIV
jgi:hypothetical protein